MEKGERIRREIIESFLKVCLDKENLDSIMDSHSENINCFGGIEDLDGWCEGIIEDLKSETIDKCKAKKLKITEEEEKGIELLVRDFIYNKGVVWANMSNVADILKEKRLTANECLYTFEKVHEASKKTLKKKSHVVSQGIQSKYSPEQIKLLFDKGMSELIKKRKDKNYKLVNLKGVVSEEDVWFLENAKTITLLFPQER